MDGIPMISDCGIRKPERYIFRLGSISAAMVMGLACVGVYNSSAKYRSRLAMVLGVAGSAGLALLGSVNIVENWTLHTGEAIFSNTRKVFQKLLVVLLFVDP